MDRNWYVPFLCIAYYWRALIHIVWRQSQCILGPEIRMCVIACMCAYVYMCVNMLTVRTYVTEYLCIATRGVRAPVKVLYACTHICT